MKEKITVLLLSKDSYCEHFGIFLSNLVFLLRLTYI